MLTPPPLLGVSKPGCFQPGCLQFLQALLLTCICALLRSFALICVFLRLTAFWKTASGNCRHLYTFRCENFCPLQGSFGPFLSFKPTARHLLRTLLRTFSKAVSRTFLRTLLRRRVIAWRPWCAPYSHGYAWTFYFPCFLLARCIAVQTPEQVSPPAHRLAPQSQPSLSGRPAAPLLPPCQLGPWNLLKNCSTWISIIKRHSSPRAAVKCRFRRLSAGFIFLIIFHF